jgi:CRP-like cAMP-binding protein
MAPADTLDSLTFFRELDDDARQLVASISQARSYGKGDTVFEEGAAIGPLRVLVKGMVSFRQRQRSGGEDAMMGTVSDRGEIFGISALIGTREAYDYSAVCLEDTDVIEIDGQKLTELCESKPDVGVRILRRLTQVVAERLYAAREQIRSRIRPGLISHG